MARTTLIVDTDAIKAQISALVKEGFDSVLKHVTEAITAAIAVYKQDTKVAEHGLTGMRDQIKANVNILLPLIGSKHGMSFFKGNLFAIAPEIHVITVGQEPNIKAYVLQGPATYCDKVIDADAGATAGEALKKLLVLTQSMLDFHIDEIGNAAAMGTPKQFGPAAGGGWASNSLTNPSVSFNFSYAGSDTSDDSALGNCGSFPVITAASGDDFSTANTLYDVADEDVYYTN